MHVHFNGFDLKLYDSIRWILLEERSLEILDLHVFCLNCKIYENMIKELALNIAYPMYS